MKMRNIIAILIVVGLMALPHTARGEDYLIDTKRLSRGHPVQDTPPRLQLARWSF